MSTFFFRKESFGKNEKELVARPFIPYDLAMSTTSTTMRNLTEQTACYFTYFFTFVVCPAIAGYSLTTLYFIFKDFPN